MYSQRSTPICRTCAGYGHTSESCPHKRCNRCGATGHSQPNCPTRRHCWTCGSNGHNQDQPHLCDRNIPCSFCGHSGHVAKDCTSDNGAAGENLDSLLAGLPSAGLRNIIKTALRLAPQEMKSIVTEQKARFAAQPILANAGSQTIISTIGLPESSLFPVSGPARPARVRHPDFRPANRPANNNHRGTSRTPGSTPTQRSRGNSAPGSAANKGKQVDRGTGQSESNPMRTPGDGSGRGPGSGDMSIDEESQASNVLSNAATCGSEVAPSRAVSRLNIENDDLKIVRAPYGTQQRDSNGAIRTPGWPALSVSVITTTGEVLHVQNRGVLPREDPRLVEDMVAVVPGIPKRRAGEAEGPDLKRRNMGGDQNGRR